MFGAYDIAQVHFSKFLEEEIINKMLIIISFEEALADMDIQNISIVYKNNWEELFVRRFSSIEKMKSSFAKIAKISPGVETHYYIQRNKSTTRRLSTERKT